MNLFSRKSGGGVVELVDEILSPVPTAKGLSIHWQEFGSNGLEKADYSRGVLERFTRRAKKDFHDKFTDSNGNHHALGNIHVKVIVNPRYVKRQNGPHQVNYFEGLHTVDERGVVVLPGNITLPIVADKIAVNHYRCKSKEEFVNKLRRGSPTNYPINDELFRHFDNNDEFDDGILRYTAERVKNFKLPDKSDSDERLLNALSANLLPTVISTTPPNFYVNKMETFLTCRAVAAYLQTRLTDDSPAKYFEEASLKAILKTFNGINFADARILIRELPNLLSLPYPVTKDLHTACLNIIPQIMHVMRLNKMWDDYSEFSYLYDLLKII